MESVLKITKQPLRAVSRKQQFLQEMIISKKYLGDTHEGAHFHQNGRHRTSSSTINKLFHGNSPIIPKIE